MMENEDGKQFRMKIIHINTSSQGGAGIAAQRLHRALREFGVSSAFISKDLSIDFDGNIINDAFFRYIKPSLLQKITHKLRVTFFPKKSQKVEREIRAKTPRMAFEIMTTPFSTYQLENHPLVIEADIVNLHWVGYLMDCESFFTNCEKPIVWTLHDMNPFLGLFHYLGDENQNETIIGKLDSRVKNIKFGAIQKVVNGALVSPSKWLLDAAQGSGVFDHFRNLRAIPNSIDLATYKTLDRKQLRMQFSLDEDEFVLLFASGNIDNPRKGADLLREALEDLTIPATVLTVGKGKLKINNPKIKMISLGYAETQRDMVKYYSLANALVLPSREDNLPNTMLESFACGTPVISFNLGGMKEYIIEGINGSLATDITGKMLADAIEKFYNNRMSYGRDNIIESAKRTFHPEKQAKAYGEVYRKLLEDNALKEK